MQRGANACQAQDTSMRVGGPPLPPPQTNTRLQVCLRLHPPGNTHETHMHTDGEAGRRALG